ncbi:hypothetical protein BDV93DRAFT_567127 [Ceratobasidium sp. AG-I]|nr:hypothetical protein BDV93DRAFT_567127 [Ceratobasidium sp. AG-I]
MPVSSKRKLQLANIERALQGKRARQACEDSKYVLPASAQADNTQPYGASDSASLEQHSANLIARASDTQSDDSGSSSEDESDVGDEPDEGMVPRTPLSFIEVKVVLNKINASSKCEYPGVRSQIINILCTAQAQRAH